VRLSSAQNRLNVDDPLPTTVSEKVPYYPSWNRTLAIGQKPVSISADVTFAAVPTMKKTTLYQWTSRNPPGSMNFDGKNV